MNLKVRTQDGKNYSVPSFDWSYGDDPAIAYVPYDGAEEYNEFNYVYLIAEPFETVSYEGDVYTFDPTVYPRIRVKSKDGQSYYVANAYTGYRNEYADRIEVTVSYAKDDTRDVLYLNKIKMLNRGPTQCRIRVSVITYNGFEALIEYTMVAGQTEVWPGIEAKTSIRGQRYLVLVEMELEGAWYPYPAFFMDSYGANIFIVK